MPEDNRKGLNEGKWPQKREEESGNLLKSLGNIIKAIFNSVVNLPEQYDKDVNLQQSAYIQGKRP